MALASIGLFSLPTRFEHFHEPARLHPVGSNADGQLIVLYRLAAAAADITVYVAGIEPTLRQEELELLPLLQGERGLVLRPGGLERPETAQPVGEMADR